MASYNVSIKPSALKELERLGKKEIAKLVERIEALAREPRPLGSAKLSGQERYRIRQGDYRIVYGIDDQTCTVDVVKIGDRKEIYR